MFKLPGAVLHCSTFNKSYFIVLLPDIKIENICSFQQMKEVIFEQVLVFSSVIWSVQVSGSGQGRCPKSGLVGEQPVSHLWETHALFNVWGIITLQHIIDMNSIIFYGRVDSIQQRGDYQSCETL